MITVFQIIWIVQILVMEQQEYLYIVQILIQMGYGEPGTQTNFCDALVEEGWVTDCSDVNDNIFCESNIYDDWYDL